ncbi:MAG: proline racemase family protein, partial [Pseudomonadota bacterium]
MRWTKTLTLVEAHAEGEVGRVVTGGVLDLPGASMLEKMNYINERDDSIRRFCVFEPRGSAQMSTNLLLPPTRPDADAGFIVLQGDRAHAMSGSNCICVVTVVLETGILPMTEPETIVRLDTPAGLVTARAECADGKCRSV